MKRIFLIIAISYTIIFSASILKADNPPFELNVVKEGGKLVKIHSGFLGLYVIDKYYGFNIVDQYWAVDKNGTRVCYVECKGEGVSKCEAYIDGTTISLIFSGTNVDVDMGIFQKTINELISLSDFIITEDHLIQTKTKKIDVKDNNGNSKILLFTAKYSFSSISTGIINISLHLL